MVDFAANNTDLLLMGDDKQQVFSNSMVTANGTPNWVTGEFGNAISYDGSGAGTISVKNCNFSDTAGTIEAWANITGSSYTALVNVTSSTGACVQNLRQWGGQIIYQVYYGANQLVVASPTLTPGWHHLAATYTTANGGKIELFVDGVSQGSLPGYVATDCGVNATCAIGGGSGNSIVGSLDEVRLSSIVQYTSNFTPPTTAFSVDGNTRLLMHLDSTSGTPVPVLEFAPAAWNLQNVPLPDYFDDQATCYAVYDFLEQYCGVRWFDPGDYGSVYPNTPTLSVSGSGVTELTPTTNLRDSGFLATGYGENPNWSYYYRGIYLTQPPPRDCGLSRRIEWCRLHLHGLLGQAVEQLAPIP